MQATAPAGAFVAVRCGRVRSPVRFVLGARAWQRGAVTDATWVKASPSPWFDDGAGDGFVVTLGARALVARRLADDVERAVETIHRSVVEAGVDGSAVATVDGRVRLDARALPPPRTARAFEVVADRVRACPSTGVILVGGARREAPDLVREVGGDALAWAWLRCARPRMCPPSLEPGASLLAGRTDGNPLALVRRAHARLQLRSHLPRGAGDVSSTPAEVATALALVHQGALTSVETGRSGPVCVAIEGLAAASLRTLERETSESRTNLPWVGSARRVLAGALAAAGIAAPVPY